MRGKFQTLAVLLVASLVSVACDDDSDALDDDLDAAADGDAGDIKDGKDGCARHESVESCMDAVGCEPAFGDELLDDGNGGWCSADLRFLGCVAEPGLCAPGKVDCPESCLGEKVVCDGDRYWLTSDCVPDSLAICETPGELGGSCQAG